MKFRREFITENQTVSIGSEKMILQGKRFIVLPRQISISSPRPAFERIRIFTGLVVVYSSLNSRLMLVEWKKTVFPIELVFVYYRRTFYNNFRKHFKLFFASNLCGRNKFAIGFRQQILSYQYKQRNHTSV